jgi:hypothetical protein
MLVFANYVERFPLGADDARREAAQVSGRGGSLRAAREVLNS